LSRAVELEYNVGGTGMRTNAWRPVVWYPAVLIGALVGGAVGNLGAATLSILIGETIFYFLSLGIIALFAALGAVWAGNALAGRDRRELLWVIVGVSEVAALVVALANLAFVEVSQLNTSVAPQINASTAALVLVAAAAAWRFHQSGGGSDGGTPRDARSAAILLALAMLFLIVGFVVDGAFTPVA
jgi:hypothetical protein